MRFVGGPITDRIGRRNVVFFSAIVASIGIVIFIFTPVLGIPLLGILLWGLGDSIGLAMCIAAMGDDEKRVHARMTFLWTIVYVANIVVGPIIGQLSGALGLMGALVAPLVFLVAAGLVSRAVGEAHPDAVVVATPTTSETSATEA